MVKSDINKMVSKLKQDSKVKAQIEKTLQDYKNQNPNKNISYKFVCNPKEFDSKGGYIEIIDADQGIKIKLHGIIYDMCNVLGIKYGNWIDFGDGDGDEGCIYLHRI
jgi:hypothetical protein